MFKRIYYIASNTFKDVARHKMLVIQLVYICMLLGIYYLFGHVAESSANLEFKMVQDTGLTLISLFGMMISLFIGSTTLRDELTHKTAYSILTLPMGRWEFYTGKFLGTLAATVVNVFIMLILLTLMLQIKFNLFWTGFQWVALFMLIEFAVMTGMVLLFSLTNSLISCFSLSILFIILGTMAEHIQHQFEAMEIPLISNLCSWIYYVVPNFGYFDIKYKILKDLVIPNDVIVNALVYGSCYLLFLLCFGSYALSKKDI